MADIPTSQLSEITSLNSGDLLNVSEDIGGGNYESKKLNVNNLDIVKGRRYYGVLTADPVSPAPSNGDTYYNSDMDMEMYYDNDRGKWLSVESAYIPFGRSGGTGSGVFYRYIDGIAFSSTQGWVAENNGTVVGIGYTRTDSDSATFEVTAGGTLITGATLASAATSGKTKTLNADFSEDDILGVRNQSGGNTTSQVHGWVKIKWRDT